MFCLLGRWWCWTGLTKDIYVAITKKIWFAVLIMVVGRILLFGFTINTVTNSNLYIRFWSVLIEALFGIKETFEYQYLYLIIDIAAMINPIIYVLLPCMGYLFGTFDKNGNIKSYIFLWLYDLFYEVHRGTYRDKQ